MLSGKKILQMPFWGQILLKNSRKKDLIMRGKTNICSVVSQVFVLEGNAMIHEIISTLFKKHANAFYT